MCQMFISHNVLHEVNSIQWPMTDAWQAGRSKKHTDSGLVFKIWKNLLFIVMCSLFPAAVEKLLFQTFPLGKLDLSNLTEADPWLPSQFWVGFWIPKNHSR